MYIFIAQLACVLKLKLQNEMREMVASGTFLDYVLEPKGSGKMK